MHVGLESARCGRDGVGGTACVSDLLYFLRNRVDFGEFPERSRIVSRCSRKALAKTRRRRRGFSDSYRARVRESACESTASIRGSPVQTGRTRTFSRTSTLESTTTARCSPCPRVTARSVAGGSRFRGSGFASIGDTDEISRAND